MPKRTNQRPSRSRTPVSRPKTATPTYHQPFSTLSLEETITRLEELRSWLVQKQHRERAYLDRRAARGTYTPTDEAYEIDQRREDELLALLDELLHNAREQGGTP